MIFAFTLPYFRTHKNTIYVTSSSLLFVRPPLFSTIFYLSLSISDKCSLFSLLLFIISSLTLPLTLSPFPSRSLPFPVSLSLSLSPALSFSLPLSYFLSLSLSFSLSLSLSFLFFTRLSKVARTSLILRKMLLLPWIT